MMNVWTRHSLRYGAAMMVAVILCMTSARAQEATLRFVNETPWTLSALGISDEVLPVLAYWEQRQQQFYLELASYFDILGFQVSFDSLEFVARRFNETYSMSGTGTVMRGDHTIQLDSTDFFANRGDLYVSFRALQQVFFSRIDPV